VKERPILFSAPMIRAILAGTKTQTRRIVKYDITGPNPPTGIYDWHDPRTREWKGAHGAPQPFNLCNASRLCPYGQPGDRLWVRETWGVLYEQYIDDLAHEPTFWKADYSAEDLREQILPRWRPSIHMPRARSRITLELTDVRVERLAAITPGDCLAEGIPPNTDGPSNPDGLRAQFAELWDGINSKDDQRFAWNPWVWALCFRRLL
jgi:hypothetical protein